MTASDENASAKDDDGDLVLSYRGLRRAIGIIGVALPFVLVLGQMALQWALVIENSISDYYYTVMGDVFVGSMCAIGVFMFSYRGYDEVDARVGNTAGLCAVGVALFPTSPEDATILQKVIGGAHLTFAFGFFVMLGVFSLYLFTRTDPNQPPTPQKLARNKVYEVCGITIFGCLAAIIIVFVLRWFSPAIDPKWVLLFETFAVWAFGISWLTKGEVVLEDEPSA